MIGVVPSFFNILYSKFTNDLNNMKGDNFADDFKRTQNLSHAEYDNTIGDEPVTWPSLQLTSFPDDPSLFGYPGNSLVQLPFCCVSKLSRNSRAICRKLATIIHNCWRLHCGRLNSGNCLQGIRLRLQKIPSLQDSYYNKLTMLGGKYWGLIRQCLQSINGLVVFWMIAAVSKKRLLVPLTTLGSQKH